MTSRPTKIIIAVALAGLALGGCGSTFHDRSSGISATGPWGSSGSSAATMANDSAVMTNDNFFDRGGPRSTANSEVGPSSLSRVR